MLPVAVRSGWATIGVESVRGASGTTILPEFGGGPAAELESFRSGRKDHDTACAPADSNVERSETHPQEAPEMRF
ncbi:variant surface glycoprotein [Microbacterium sp. HM58-2]|nr:variant surface glycoprotein [Microbacterium sp. HM58-2]